MDLISRAEAKEAGQTWYFTGKPCKYDHVAKRWTLDGTCAECKASRNKSWWANNKEHGRCLVYKWREKNPEQHKAMVNTAVREWGRKNPGKRNAYTANRRALLLRATPPWSETLQIRELYVEAQARGLQVDHEIPLNNPYVCGLHVIANLQLLSPEENRSKSNSFERTYE